MCLNIEVEVHGTGKSQFFIRLYHVKVDDYAIIDEKGYVFSYYERRFFSIFRSSHIDQ